MSKSSKDTRAKVKGIIKTSTSVVGITKEHALKQLFGGHPELLPEIKSVGVVRIPDTNNFVSFLMKSKGNEVIEIEVDEPNTRMVSEEMSKIKFVETFSVGE